MGTNDAKSRVRSRSREGSEERRSSKKSEKKTEYHSSKGHRRSSRERSSRGDSADRHDTVHRRSAKDISESDRKQSRDYKERTEDKEESTRDGSRKRDKTRKTRHRSEERDRSRSRRDRSRSREKTSRRDHRDKGRSKDRKRDKKEEKRKDDTYKDRHREKKRDKGEDKDKREDKDRDRNSEKEKGSGGSRRHREDRRSSPHRTSDRPEEKEEETRGSKTKGESEGPEKPTETKRLTKNAASDREDPKNGGMEKRIVAIGVQQKAADESSEPDATDRSLIKPQDQATQGKADAEVLQQVVHKAESPKGKASGLSSKKPAGESEMPREEEREVNASQKEEKEKSGNDVIKSKASRHSERQSRRRSRSRSANRRGGSRERKRSRYSRSRSRQRSSNDRRRSSRGTTHRSRSRGRKRSRSRSRSRARDRKHPGIPQAKPTAGADPLLAKLMAAHPTASLQEILAKLQHINSVAAASGTNPSLLVPNPSTKQQRELYVGNLPPGITAPQLIEFMGTVIQQLGINTGPGNPILNAWVSADGHYAFCEFRSAEECDMALNLTGLTLLGQPLKVGRPKTYQESLASGMGVVPTPLAGLGGSVITPADPSKLIPAGGRLLMSNIPQYLTENAIKEIISPFGELKQFELLKEEGEKEPGKALFEFVNPMVANMALTALNGFDILGQKVVVQWATGDKHQFSEKASTGPQVISKVVCLENMVTEEELVDDEEVADIEEDTREECKKYGELVSIYIPRHKNGDAAEDVTKIYVEFTSVESAEKAAKALGVRVFSGRAVKAYLYSEEDFATKKLKSGVQKAEADSKVKLAAPPPADDMD